MLALHDIVEIDVGDTFHYHKSADTSVAEQVAASRIFGLLPEDQREWYSALWREFEERQTPEARFAAAVDRIWPIFQNIAHKGGTWKEFGVSLAAAKEKNGHVTQGSSAIWDYVLQLMNQAHQNGFFHDSASETEESAL
jgi:putative hydrolase of HD superfamily